VRRGVGAIVVVATAVGACGGRGGSTSTNDGATTAGTNAASLGGTSANLGGTIVARIGDRTLDASLVANVARARNITVYEATRLLVEESLFADAARRQGALDAMGMHARLDAVLARAFGSKLDREALAQGPITDDEIAATMGDDWIALSRPETRVVVHALVREATPNGEALARQLHDLVAPTTTPEEFMRVARTLPVADPKSLIVEELPVPFRRDGRMLDPNGGALDATFAEAAFAIADVGGTSAIVHTTFGWHVIRLVAVRPPFEAPREVKANKLEGKIIVRRLGDRFSKTIESLRAAAPTQLTPTDADLMAPKIEGGAATQPALPSEP
jgi:hypothetical protein